MLRAVIPCALAFSLGLAAEPQDDPVMRARAQRAAAQGVSDGDLPPVPRGIVEPPPLPPPETHLRDTPRGKAAAKARKGKAAKGKVPAKGKAPAKPKVKGAPK